MYFYFVDNLKKEMLHILVSPAKPSLKGGAAVHHATMVKDHVRFGLTDGQCLPLQTIPLLPKVTYQGEFLFYFLYNLSTNEVLIFTLRYSNSHILIFIHMNIIAVLFLNQGLNSLGLGVVEEESRGSK